MPGQGAPAMQKNHSTGKETGPAHSGLRFCQECPQFATPPVERPQPRICKVFV